MSRTPAANEWTTAKDPVSGDTYYYHRQTKQTSWTPPPAAQPQANLSQSAVPQQLAAFQGNQASQAVGNAGSVKAAAAAFGGSAPGTGVRGQATTQPSGVLAQQQNSSYLAAQQNMPYNPVAQQKKLGAGAPGNSTAQQQVANEGAQLGQKQIAVNPNPLPPGVPMQQAASMQQQQGLPLQAAVNQGYVQPSMPTLPSQMPQPQYQVQGPAASFPQPGQINPQGYPQQPYSGAQQAVGTVANGYNTTGVNAAPAATQNRNLAASSVNQGVPAKAAEIPAKKFEVLKDIADPKLPEAESKKVLQNGGCKVALDLDLDSSIAKSPDFSAKIKKEIATAISVKESQIQIDDVRAGSIKLGLTIKPSDQGNADWKAPSEAANRLATLVKSKGLASELLKAARSCEVVFDAMHLKTLKETSEKEFEQMKEKLAFLLPLEETLPLPAGEQASKSSAAPDPSSSAAQPPSPPPVIIPPPASTLSPQRLYACSLGTGFVGTYEEVQAHEQRILAQQAIGWGTIATPAHAPATVSAGPAHAPYTQTTTIVAPSQMSYQQGLYGSQAGVAVHTVGPDFSMQVPQMGYPGQLVQHTFAAPITTTHW